MKQGMLKYTSRDYDSIIAEFWELVPKLTDLWKPDADADPGVVLGKFLASIADMLGVNVDILANELYAPSVTQRKNAEKLFGLIGYSLGWYTAARTEVTFTNIRSDSDVVMNFGFNGAFSTLEASTDIVGQPRRITYNILPTTSSYGEQESKASRSVITSSTDVFVSTDRVTLKPGDSVTRVAIEGELRNVTISVADVKNNNYIIKLPSQHIDTRSVWLKAKSNLSADDYLPTRWTQVESPVDFNEAEPRFAVVYDNYGNAQLEVSNYLNELENYDSNYFIVYWFDCSGVIGSVSANVLSNLIMAIPSNDTTVNNFGPEDVAIVNLANTIEIPHTYTVTGKSPETARQAYLNSRNYINTWNSLITIPDFNRFLRRSSEGVDCGMVIDCQKALEINLAIYNDSSLTDSQKKKKYITYNDFPKATNSNLNWRNILKDMGIPINDKRSVIPFAVDFQTFAAVCYAIHNDFKDDTYMPPEFVDVAPERYTAEIVTTPINYIQYRPSIAFTDGLMRDFRGLQAMSVDLSFGYARIFPWFVIGEIYPKNPVSRSVGDVIVQNVKEALSLYFSPANRQFGQLPTVMEVVEVIQNADSHIRYFDAGSLTNPVINWGEKRTYNGNSTIVKFDVEYFNPISFARYQDVGAAEQNIRIAPDWIID